MKNKFIFIMFSLILALSLLLNYFYYLSRFEVHFNGGSDAMFYQYNDIENVNFDGCVLWKDESLRSHSLFQYWKINAASNRKETSCSIQEAIQMSGKVLLSEPNTCEVQSLDSNSKTAIINFKDSVISVNGNTIVFNTANPNEKGGGELAPCYDKRFLSWWP